MDDTLEETLDTIISKMGPLMTILLLSSSWVVLAIMIGFWARVDVPATIFGLEQLGNHLPIVNGLLAQMGGGIKTTIKWLPTATEVFVGLLLIYSRQLTSAQMRTLEPIIIPATILSLLDWVTDTFNFATQPYIDVGWLTPQSEGLVGVIAIMLYWLVNIAFGAFSAFAAEMIITLIISLNFKGLYKLGAGIGELAGALVGFVEMGIVYFDKRASRHVWHSYQQRRAKEQLQLEHAETKTKQRQNLSHEQTQLS